MIAKAYMALDAIDRGVFEVSLDRDSWLKAFQTVRWVCVSADAVRLTADGRQALDEMRRTRPFGAHAELGRLRAASVRVPGAKVHLGSS
jgi:hypothetical protein